MKYPKLYNYVYLTTNLISGKQYIGDRSCNCEVEKDRYLGSGIYYKNAEKLYGKQNFQKQILKIFETRKEAFDAQAIYIIKYDTLVPNGYNVSPKGGYGILESYLSEETRKKIGESNKGKLKGRKLSEEHKLKISINNGKGMLGKKHSQESIIKMKNNFPDRTGENNSFYHKHHTMEVKQKLSESHKGKESPIKGHHLSEETKQKMSEKAKLHIGEKNTMYNRKHKEETKQKMSEKAKHRKTIICTHCNKEMVVSMHNRWHGENCKNKKNNE